MNEDKNNQPDHHGRAGEAPDLVAGEAMTIEENLRMIESWLRPLRPGEEPFMRERAIPIHIQFIREALIPLESITEAAKAFIWEPENWEAYEDSKTSISVAWPPEFLLLAQAVEDRYGPMPVDDESDTNTGASPGTTE